MTDEPQRSPVRIDAAKVDWVDIIDDGRRLRVRLRDDAGLPASVSLPVESLSAVLTAVLRASGERFACDPGQVHRLEGWTLDRGDQGLLLTLQLPDGSSITLAVQPWQIRAIASLAGQDSPPSRRLN